MEKDYIFELQKPIFFDYDFLSRIEEKLYSNQLNEKEALYLLKWITFRVQSFLLPDFPTLEYRCGDAAALVSALLKTLNIDHFNFNMKSVINTTYNIHELILAYLPIRDSLIKYVIDPTFRQFLIKDYCKPNRTKHYKFENPLMEYDRKLPTYPGYYLSLTKEGTELGTQILNEGYFKLNDINMKLYGDAFMKYSAMYIGDYCLCSGEEYIDGIEPSHNEFDTIINEEIYLSPIKLKKRMCNNG